MQFPGLNEAMQKLKVMPDKRVDGLLSDVNNYSSLEYQFSYINRKFEYRYKDCWESFKYLGFRNLFKKTQLEICSVGCGPCAELVALQNYLSDKKTNLYGYDICDWSQVCNLLEIPFEIRDINQNCTELKKYDLIMCLWTIEFLKSIDNFESFILDVLADENVLFVVNPDQKLLHFHKSGTMKIGKELINVKKVYLPTDCNYKVSACIYSRRLIK
eukprot:NODE_598_length_6262_cov_0.141652.p4 type:complete len:215 gc:universal NODE_598_length_6262_cov_0.141652:2432-3076(+)